MVASEIPACVVHSIALIVAAMGATTVSAADVAYGQLAPGAASYSEVKGVQAEICRDHLFDPSFGKVRIPTGYRLVSAAEVSKKDKDVASLLERDGRYQSYFVGSLCFMSVEHFVVDGVRVHPSGPTPMAFWWARAEEDPRAKRDARMLGKTQWLQLASWYAPATDRARIVGTDPMAQFVELEMNQIGPNQWKLRLVLANEVVTAEVRGDGQRKKRNAPQPGFMTVPFTGEGAAFFSVYTYFGHHHQDAKGSWRAAGSGVFSGAFALRDEAQVFGTFFQDGWQARGGLYRSVTPDAQQAVPADGPRPTGSPAAERNRWASASERAKK